MSLKNVNCIIKIVFAITFSIISREISHKLKLTDKHLQDKILKQNFLKNFGIRYDKLKEKKKKLKHSAEIFTLSLIECAL